MDTQAKDEDIFYSDEEFSDSEELYQVPEYFPGKAERPGDWIDRPITQISAGLAGLGGGLLGQARRQAPAPRTLTYSSIASKQPLQPQKPNINKPKQPPPPTQTIFKSDSKSKMTCSRVSETALMAGYRFRASDPQHDPRYPQDQQMMVGPIPGHLDHDVIYNGLRSIFQAWGPVCFMFLHKSAVKDNDSGKPVKFGYVVFAEKGVAQKVLKGGSIPFNGGIKIKVTPMS